MADFNLQARITGNQKAQSRQDILERARQERESRREVKRRLTCAEKIQRCWRGRQARVAYRRQVLQQVARKFTPVAADPSQQLLADDVCYSIIRPLAQCLVCPTNGTPAATIFPRTSLLRDTLTSAALRPSFALIIRSLTNTEPPHNVITCLLHNSDSFQRSWHRFCVLCAAICMQADPADSLLASAASRCVLLMIDRSQWRCILNLPAHPPTHPSSTTNSTPSLDTLTSDASIAAARAHSTCLSVLEAQPEFYQAVKHSFTTADIKQPDSPVANMTARMKLNLVKAAIILLTNSPANPGLSPQNTASHHWVQHILQGTSMASQPPSILVLMRSPPYTCLIAILSYLRITKLPANITLPALANVCMLIVGSVREAPTSRATQHSTTPPESAYTWRELQTSPILEDVAIGEAYVTVSQRVLESALDKGVVLGKGVAESVRMMAWPISQRVHLDGVIALGTATRNGDWTGRRLHMEDVIGMFALWVKVDDLLADTIGGSRVSPVTNLLAFSGTWMARMWKELTHCCRIPVDVPMQAHRGLDIPSLAGGIPALTHHQAQLLELFCRLHAHLLFVLDDTSFYEKDDPFPLSTQRAIALSLNSLIFRTHMPTTSLTLHPDRMTQTAPATLQKSLLKYAHEVLQQLHMHDVRRRFCSPTMWLAPWTAWWDAHKDEVTEAALVDSTIRILLSRGDEDFHDSESAALCAHSSQVADLLQSAPHCVPYSLRVDLFRALLTLDKKSTRMDGDLVVGQRQRNRRDVTIRRANVMEDAFMQLNPLGNKIRDPLMVFFVNEHGMREAGIDHGGLLKELIEQVLLAGFNPDYGLMESTSEGKLCPSPMATRLPNGLDYLHFLGLVVGKSLYEGILLDVPLAPLFVMSLQGRRPKLDDLFTLDRDLHRSLLQVKSYEGDVEDLCLDFTVEEDVFGKKVTHDIIHNGSQVPVTNDNKLAYIHQVADWHLTRKMGSTAASFAKGMSKVVPVPFLRMFSVTEVNELLGGGSDAGIDTADMRNHVKYGGGYTDSSNSVKMFWSVLESLTLDDRRLVLKFATGTGRAPLGGFKHLEPCFTIYKVDCDASVLARIGGNDVDRLPSASTCYNMLKLPNYRRAATMKKKLLYAVHSNAGFDLS